MNSFIFLYPIPEYMEFEIERGAFYNLDDKKYDTFRQRLELAVSEEAKARIREEARKAAQRDFKEVYRAKLSACIEARYRSRGFRINYVIFDGHELSDVVVLQQGDTIVRAGIDFKTHTTKRPDGTHSYADNDFILNQLGNIRVIRIAGFHMWDCVDKLARKAHERGLDTLVDEDLTEFFAFSLSRPGFRVDKYPTYNPREDGNWGDIDLFMKPRKQRPWLWQDY